MIEIQYMIWYGSRDLHFSGKIHPWLNAKYLKPAHFQGLLWQMPTVNPRPHANCWVCQQWSDTQKLHSTLCHVISIPTSTNLLDSDSSRVSAIDVHLHCGVIFVQKAARHSLLNFLTVCTSAPRGWGAEVGRSCPQVKKISSPCVQAIRITCRVPWARLARAVSSSPASEYLHKHGLQNAQTTISHSEKSSKKSSGRLRTPSMLVIVSSGARGGNKNNKLVESVWSNTSITGP